MYRVVIPLFLLYNTGNLKFHTFGYNTKPAIVYIHGMLTPWQIWDEDFEIANQVAPMDGEKVFIKDINSCFGNKEFFIILVVDKLVVYERRPASDFRVSFRVKHLNRDRLL